MASLQVVNPRADVLRTGAAIAANLNAAAGLQEVLQTNLGPRGTLKMLVGGGGTLRVTKDGNVLLQEMQIQHPTAALIARGATAQDAATGDGSTSTVVVVGETMKHLVALIQEGIHPRILCRGLADARMEALKVLDSLTVPTKDLLKNREFCKAIAASSIGTKVDACMTDGLAEVVVDALRCIGGVADDAEPLPDAKGGMYLDLHMVEIMHMKHGLSNETRLIRGMVMDHGCRHPDMPTKLKNCHIFICNVSLEYEKSEVNSSFLYQTAQQRESLADAERRFTDRKVKQIIDFKREVCKEGESFVVLNQKGIDPPSLDMFAKEGIMALRRVKRRNMERLAYCCGGCAVNSVEELKREVLGWAGEVWETSLGDDKFTFVEDVKHPRSCAILIKGPTDYAISQVKDALRDGLRAVHNAVLDQNVVPGAGAFEIACAERLKMLCDSVPGKERQAFGAFAEGLLAIPKQLARNAGFDAQDTLLELRAAYKDSEDGKPVGLDILTGKPCKPANQGIWDGYRVKRQSISICTSLLEQLLLVDEIMRAGRQMGRS